MPLSFLPTDTEHNKDLRDLLYSIWLALGGASGGASGLTDAQLRASAVPVSLPTGAQALTSVAGAATGSVAAGASAVVFLPQSNFVGTIDGVSYPGANWQVIPFGAQPGKTLPAIPFVVTSGTLNYYKLV